MVLHTIVDISEIMIDNTISDTKREFIQKENSYFEGSKTNDGFLINRIISTNPSDYINPQFSIGNKLK